MISQYGLTQLHRQPGARLRTTRGGLQVYAPTYSASIETIQAAHDRLTLGDPYQQLTPTDPIFRGLLLEDREMIFDEGNIAHLYLSWEGVTTETLPPPFWRIIRTPGEEPIDAHPRFASSIGGTHDDPKNNAQFDWDPETETGTKAFLGFPSGAPNNLAGVTKYLCENIVVTKEYVTLTQPDDSFEIPIIRTPVLGSNHRGLRRLPQIPLGYNWLQTDLVYTARGNVYEVTEEYTASGANGWNSTIYPTY